MSYQVLERDEHGYATHTIDNGNESWYQNYYNEDGKWIDLKSIHFRIHKEEVNLYTKYNENCKAVAYYTTAIKGLFVNWYQSNWHCKLNKIKGLTYQEYKEWLNEIGVSVENNE